MLARNFGKTFPMLKGKEVKGFVEIIAEGTIAFKGTRKNKRGDYRG